MSITKIKNALMVCGAIMTAAVFMIGCGDSDDDKKGGRGSGGNVVNGANEAWINWGDSTGFIFKSNGTYQLIIYFYGSWTEGTTGQYSTSGNHLTIDLMGDEGTLDYSVSGNTFTIHDPYGHDDDVYVRVSGITVGGFGGGDDELHDLRLYRTNEFYDLQWVLSTDEDIELDLDPFGSFFGGSYFLGSGVSKDEWYSRNDTLFLTGQEYISDNEVVVKLAYSFQTVGSEQRLLLTDSLSVTTTWLPRGYNYSSPQPLGMAKSKQPLNKANKVSQLIKRRGLKSNVQ